MNFKKIIKAMDSLDSKQDEINLRFSSKPSGHQHYRSCLQEDENEDLRIYGNFLSSFQAAPTKIRSRNFSPSKAGIPTTSRALPKETI
jgi:hypothetical protein